MQKKHLAGLLWDVGLPAVAYYGGRALGYDVLPALAAGAVAALLRVAFVAVVRRRLNGIGLIIGATFALLLVVSLFTGDPRVLLARESVLSGAGGLLLVGSCLIGKPLIYTAARKLNAGKAELLAQWDELWRTQPQFRRRFTTLSAVMGGILLADAIVRVVLICLLPVDTMANLSPALHFGALALVAGYGLWHRKHAMERANAR
ncbi:VC0807 family protein [Kribbella sp. NPDC051952]|uniref:VC0807 family protein n=1 Tax=Kribbella sp. NPDC051952 TaxID=3154851 RepID=UPI00341D983B